MLQSILERVSIERTAQDPRQILETKRKRRNAMLGRAAFTLADLSVLLAVIEGAHEEPNLGKAQLDRLRGFAGGITDTEWVWYTDAFHNNEADPDWDKLEDQE